MSSLLAAPMCAAFVWSLDKQMNDESEPEADELREYMIDMLSQLANIAAACGEPGIALILQTIVASRGATFEANNRPNGKSNVARGEDE